MREPFLTLVPRPDPYPRTTLDLRYLLPDMYVNQLSVIALAPDDIVAPAASSEPPPAIAPPRATNSDGLVIFR